MTGLSNFATPARTRVFGIERTFIWLTYHVPVVHATDFGAEWHQGGPGNDEFRYEKRVLLSEMFGRARG